MAVFHHTFTDPLKPDDVDLGLIEGEQLVRVFLEYPWDEWLQKMESVKSEDVHFSPTLNVFHREQKRKMLLSAVRENGQVLFYVFYVRPKQVKRLLGLINRLEEKYTTEVVNQTKEQAGQILGAFVQGDTAYLEERVK
jgi:hypothetical protein